MSLQPEAKQALQAAFVCPNADGDSHTYARSPYPGESFRGFLKRVTGAGHQAPMGFDAPQKYTQAFCGTWQQRTWDLGVYNETRRLQREGIDPDRDWLAAGKGDVPADVLFPDAATRETARTALERLLQRDYPALAGTAEAILAKPWKQLTDTELEAYVRTLVDEAPLFGGRRLVDHHQDVFDVSADTVLANSHVFVARGERFAELARQLGWSGPINFRGLTAEVPGQPGTYWIILNRDIIEQRSEYQSPLMQFAELLSIDTHERGHIFQDLAAKRLGLTLIPQSMEGVAILEGQAEYAAITAMRKAGEHAHPKSPWRYFAAREGQHVVRSNELLNQYTVGLPLVAAFDQSANAHIPIADLLRVASGQATMDQVTARWAEGR